MLSLNIENLSVSYGKEKILDNISFSLEQKEILAIIGPNGSGKTTLLRSILGLQMIQAGHITINGHSIQQMIRQNKISYLPQYHNVNQLLPLTVYEVVAQGIKARKAWFEILNIQEKEKIEEVLIEVQLIDKKAELFSNLSGGQRQKALLALALVTNPAFLFLDEPTNALDMRSVEQIYHIISKLRTKNVGILIISHDLSTIVSTVDKVGVLMHKMQYFGKSSELPEEIMHQVFGVHLKISKNEPHCKLCTH